MQWFANRIEHRKYIKYLKQENLVLILKIHFEFNSSYMSQKKLGWGKQKAGKVTSTRKKQLK